MEMNPDTSRSMEVKEEPLDHAALQEQYSSCQEARDSIKFEDVKVESKYPETRCPPHNPNVKNYAEVSKQNDKPLKLLSTSREQRASMEMNPDTSGSTEIKKEPLDRTNLQEQYFSHQEARDFIKFENIKLEPTYSETSYPPHDAEVSEHNDKPMTLVSTSGESRTSLAMSRRGHSECDIEQPLLEDEENEEPLSDQGSEVLDNLSDAEVQRENQPSLDDSFISDDEEDAPLVQRLSYYFGRDKRTKWSNVPNNRVRNQPHNTQLHLPGVRRNGVGVTSPVSAWNLFISDEIIEKIVAHTNEFIERKSELYRRSLDCQKTDSVEIRAVFGLIYIAGTLRLSHTNLEDMYTTDGTGIPVFPNTMTMKRLKFLLNSLRFDDANARTARKASDRAAAIRKVLDKFTENCSFPYSVGENVVIDEMLTAFRGKCPFKQYIKSKPAKCGIKFYAVVDSETFYLLNLELYAGEQPEGPYQISNAPGDVVKRLIRPLSGTGRNLTVNNWHISTPLAEDLSKNHNLSVVGTMRQNDKEIPPSFVAKGRPVYSSLFGFSDVATLVSYVPMKNRSVVLVSTFHNSAEIDESAEEQQKPSVITFYNQTKRGVDEVDKKASMYSVSRRNSRWPLTVFFRLLDIAGINAMVILRSNGVEIGNRRKYLRHLGTQLTREYIERRATKENLPRTLRRNIREYLNLEANEPEATAATAGKTSRGACKICPSKKRRQSKTHCASCNRNICRDHTTFICTVCYNDED